MTTFTAAVRRWRNSPFPRGSSVDVVDELHAQLAELDAAVADFVIPTAKGRNASQGVVDTSARLDDLSSRLSSIAGLEQAEKVLVAEYRDYCGLLKDVYTEAIRQRSGGVDIERG